MNFPKKYKFSKKILRHVVFSSLLEFGPVVLFLFSFGRVSIYESTLILMIATIISTIVTYKLQKRIPYLALYVAVITLIFGYMTLYFHKVKFIQMRDTLYDVTCALTLIIGVLIRVPFLKLAFGEIVAMTDRAWNKLTYLWIGYFITVALSNELARRFFSLHDWFEFKSWVVLITMTFGFIALYISYEEKEEGVR